ncbi:MAG: bifunctional riboflavin kinase/FAD synthetase [Bacteroidetes bacterium]|nr:bifunctional riboflavin kinase/FAD synthetase [Bacteroidota bacterium]
MNVHTDLEKLPLFNNAVVTIGTFDGVHTGHQQIIEQLKNEAVKIDGETVIISFHPHPRKIINGNSKEVKLINTLEERIALLAAKGIDHLVIVPFTEAFAEQSAEEYIRDFLIEKFKPHTIIIGYDHRFGKGRKGDYHLLEAGCSTYHYTLKEIPVHVLNAISVSSTRIREAILQGDIETAKKLLGYDFFFEATIVEGNKLGRTIGYPTANLKIENEEKLLPGDGVYAVKAAIENGKLGIGNWELGNEITPNLKGMMNIGNRPTVGGTPKTIEVNLFDFDQDIYGKKLRVYVKKYLRGEQKFSGLDALKTQLAKDKIQAVQYLTKE